MAFRFGFSGLRAREGCNEQRSLVAVSCTHRNALAALGTTARKNCSSALRFHAAAKPVGLRAAAAIRLKCALRHGSALLKNFFDENGCRLQSRKILGAAISEYISSHGYPQNTRSMSTFSQAVVQLETRYTNCIESKVPMSRKCATIGSVH